MKKIKKILVVALLLVAGLHTNAQEQEISNLKKTN